MGEQIAGLEAAVRESKLELGRVQSDLITAQGFEPALQARTVEIAAVRQEASDATARLEKANSTAATAEAEAASQAARVVALEGQLAKLEAAQGLGSAEVAPIPAQAVATQEQPEQQAASHQASINDIHARYADELEEKDNVLKTAQARHADEIEEHASKLIKEKRTRVGLEEEVDALRTKHRRLQSEIEEHRERPAVDDPATDETQAMAQAKEMAEFAYLDLCPYMVIITNDAGERDG